MFALFAKFTLQTCTNTEEETQSVIPGKCVSWITNPACNSISGTWISEPATPSACNSLLSTSSVCDLDDEYYSTVYYDNCAFCGGNVSSIYFTQYGHWDYYTWLVGVEIGYEWITPGMTSVNYIAPLANTTGVHFHYLLLISF